jgi:hypothetical protein
VYETVSNIIIEGMAMKKLSLALVVALVVVAVGGAVAW